MLAVAWIDERPNKAMGEIVPKTYSGRQKSKSANVAIEVGSEG